jgi:putative tryptophan/tyrosine transport system substrate-binding protein
MFKHLWLGIALILATSGFLLLSDMKQRAGGKSAVPRVAILQFSSLGLLDEGVHGLMDQLKENGYDGTHGAVIDLYNAQNDMATSTSMSQEITSGKYDYVFSISTNCLQSVANANRGGRVKHIFGVVADPIAAKVGLNPKDPMDHPKWMVGIGTLMPVSEMMELARKFNPRVRRFGIPWNPSQANSQRYLELAREAAAQMHVELLEGSVDNTAAVGEVTSSLISRGADTILVVGDVTVALAIDAVVSECRKGKVPALTLMPNDVKRGALAGAGADFYAVGRQMGQLGTRVMRGEDTATIPISYELPKYYAFNLTVLPSLKDSWIIPDPLLSAAKIVVK